MKEFNKENITYIKVIHKKEGSDENEEDLEEQQEFDNAPIYDFSNYH